MKKYIIFMVVLSGLGSGVVNQFGSEKVIIYKDIIFKSIEKCTDQNDSTTEIIKCVKDNLLP